MITAPEVARAMYGVWRLALFDRTGIEQFGDDAEAFWRSFYAMLIAAPFYIILISLRLSGLETTNGPVHIFFVEVIAYVIGWFAYPFIMLYVVELLDRREHYYRYIAAYNWATVPLIAVLTIISVVVDGLDVALPSAALLSFMITLVILVYWWFIARVGLDIQRWAAAIAGLDFCLGIALSQVTHSML